MTIDRQITRGRKEVAWFGIGAPRDGKREFERRGFGVTGACTDADLLNPSFLAGISAVIFTQSREMPSQVLHDLKLHATRLLDYDCRVIVRAFRPAADMWTRGALRHTTSPSSVGELLPLPGVRIYDQLSPWKDVANFVAEHPAGPAPGSTLKVSINDILGLSRLPTSHRRLLKRAFYDCSEISLTRLYGGKSGAYVYLAHAELANLHGKWPLPYFVKIGTRQRIIEEYIRYHDSVDPYIPFHLRPHLIHQRCCLGAKVGIIVGDFVEGSESLADSARDGRAASAISCLFDRTLIGWHRGAQRKDDVAFQFATATGARFPSQEQLRVDRFKQAQVFGATKTLSELRQLFDKCQSTPVLVGPIHGDLHAENVRVRAGDAIVIDFFAHREGPLLCDVACLEASLLVYGLARAGENPNHVLGWFEIVKSLYERNPLAEAADHPNPKSPACWFHACVRQIRLYAREMEHGNKQYAAALALEILIKAVKDRDAKEPEATARSLAYVLGEKVLTSTF